MASYEKEIKRSGLTSIICSIIFTILIIILNKIKVNLYHKKIEI